MVTLKDIANQSGVSIATVSNILNGKSNVSLTNDYKRKNNICMKFPFDNMIDDALSHYTLQFNLYRRMLESVGVKIGDMRLIWLKEDGDYEIIKIGKLSDSILDRVLAK